MGKQLNTKGKIIAEAIEMFKIKGFNDVSINEIIDKVGISKNTFYYHFDSKEQILEEFYEVPSDISASMLEDMVTEKTSIGKLFAIYKPRMQHFDKLGRNIVKQIVITNLQDNKGTFDKSKKRAPKIHLIQEELLKQAQEDGEISNMSEPLMLMENIRNIIIGCLIIWLVDEKSDLWEITVRALDNLLGIQVELQI